VSPSLNAMKDSFRTWGVRKESFMALNHKGNVH
jgi:hypothetical protein